MSLTNKPCLVVGGGAVAKRKCETLLEYGAEVQLVAKALRADFSDLSNQRLKLEIRPFVPADVQGKMLVFVATEDEQLNRSIAALCREKHIFVNVADIPELCDFYFPALVRRGDVVMGISTGGGSPALAGALRKDIDALLPEDFGEQAEEIARLRKTLLEEGRHPAQSEEYMNLIESVRLKK
jgi:siroheme synthase-like protein